ncbi:MAG TPA: hypothetical protein VII49_01225 [Rhizomicrobium sp.]
MRDTNWVARISRAMTIRLEQYLAQARRMAHMVNEKHARIHDLAGNPV